MTRNGRIHAGSLGIVAMIVLGAGSAQSGYSSMRCGNRLVSAGDSTYTVRSVCGEPDAKTRRIEHRTVRRVVRGPCRQAAESGAPATPLNAECRYVEEHSVDVVVDEWTYDFGRTQFVQYALFEDGHLTTVEVGSYGTK